MTAAHHDHFVLKGAKCKVIDLLVVVRIRIANIVTVLEQVGFREEVTELIPECAWIARETGGVHHCHETPEVWCRLADACLLHSKVEVLVIFQVSPCETRFTEGQFLAIHSFQSSEGGGATDFSQEKLNVETVNLPAASD